jgi:hypothetical protein
MGLLYHRPICYVVVQSFKICVNVFIFDVVKHLRVCVTISSFAVHCVLKRQFVDKMFVVASSKLHIFKVSSIFSWLQSVIFSHRLYIYIFCVCLPLRYLFVALLELLC